MKNLNLLLANYYRKQTPNEVIFKRHDGVTFSLPSQDFFDPDKITSLDRKALDLAKGDVLVIYGLTGRYALELQTKGMNVYSIDPSKENIELKVEQGVQGVIDIDILEFSGLEFDTLLLLGDSSMRLGSLNNLNKVLKHATQLFNEGGCLLFKSLDLEKAKCDMPFANDPSASYAGEIRCHVPFDEAEGDEMQLLFVDFDTLKKSAQEHGLNCEQIETEGSGYLAKLTQA
ncbi:MAG: hypothetical protein AAF984_01235 [Verrucomicrobiota bacterium]